MVTSTALATRLRWSVCPGMPWSVSPGIGGQLAPDWSGHVHQNLQADNDLKAALRFLSQYRNPGERNYINSYIKLRPLLKYHTESQTELFEDNICKLVQAG